MSGSPHHPQAHPQERTQVTTKERIAEVTRIEKDTVNWVPGSQTGNDIAILLGRIYELEEGLNKARKALNFCLNEYEFLDSAAHEHVFDAERLVLDFITRLLEERGEEGG